MRAAVAAIAVLAAVAVGATAVDAARAPVRQVCHARGALPDRHCTPGAVDPHVRQSNIDSTICRSGYTRTVRPPESYTEPLKLAQMAAYGYYAGRRPSAYEEDHLIPLELGGSPRSPRNLWPEAHPASYRKDVLENRLHRAVCDGRMALFHAQDEIARDWVAAEAQFR